MRGKKESPSSPKPVLAQKRRLPTYPRQICRGRKQKESRWRCPDDMWMGKGLPHELRLKISTDIARGENGIDARWGMCVSIHYKIRY